MLAAILLKIFSCFFAAQAKVLRLTDRNTSAGLNRRSFVAGRIRSMNDSVVKVADNLHIAIQKNQKVRFKYFHYDREKKK